MQLHRLQARLLQVPRHFVVDGTPDGHLVSFLPQHVRLVDEHLDADLGVDLVRAGHDLVEVGQRRLVMVRAVDDEDDSVAVGEETLVVHGEGGVEDVHLSRDFHQLVVQEGVGLDIRELNLGGAVQQQGAVRCDLIKYYLRDGGLAAAAKSHQDDLRLRFHLRGRCRLLSLQGVRPDEELWGFLHLRHSSPKHASLQAILSLQFQGAGTVEE